MKNIVLSQPRRVAARRAAAYRPRLELLEGRLQPGSLLLGSLPGAALLDGELGSLGSDRRPVARRLVRHADFSPDAETAHSWAAAALPSAAARSAERPAPVAAAPVAAAPASSSLTDDLRALSTFAGRAAAPTAAPAVVYAVPQAAGAARAAAALARHPAAASAAVAPGRPEVQAAPLTPAALTATLRPVGLHLQAVKLQETVLHSRGDSGQPPPPAVGWATYLGGDNASLGQSIEQAANGDTYVAGSIVDPSTGAYDVLLTLVPQADPTQATEIGIPGPNGDNLVAVAVAVQNAADGSVDSVYVTANDPDAGVGYVIQLSGDLQTLLNSGGVAGVNLTGLDLGETDQTAGVYVTGSAPDPSGSGQVDTVVAELTPDLSNEVYATGVALAVGTTALDSQGNAIQVDSAGNTYEGLTVGNAIGGASTSNLAGFMSLSTGAAQIRYASGFANPVAGLNGAMNSVEIQGDNPQGFFYMTGALNNGHASPLGTDMVVAKVNARTGAVLPGGYSVRVNFDTNGTGDILGAGIEVDGSGNAYLAGSANLAPDASGNVDINGIVLKLNAAGNMFLNERIIGNTAAGTANEDHALGIALAQDDDAAGDVCVTGWTTSDQTTAQFSPAPVQAVQGDLGAAGVNAYAYCENQPIGG